MLQRKKGIWQLHYGFMQITYNRLDKIADTFVQGENAPKQVH